MEPSLALLEFIPMLPKFFFFMLGLKLLLEKNPHFLDIYCDVCHHVYDSVKKICFVFNGFIEKSIDDVHLQKFSADTTDYALSLVCHVKHLLLTWLSAFE